MKSIFKYITMALTVGAVGTLPSCNKFLDLEPQSVVTPNSYFESVTQLRAYLAPLYLGIIHHTGGFGMYGQDSGTDNMVNITCEAKYGNGLWQVVTDNSGVWNFEEIYKTNYFIKNVSKKIEDGKINGSASDIEQCLGEAYWFRAYAYYKKYIDIGDMPIVTDVLENNNELLTDASKRMPRNEVARFILSDLDKAIELMSNVSPDGGRRNLLSRNVAYLLKSRVALFEASWLENFKGTAFVPGGDGWPGASKDYNANFKYQAGSIDEEIKFFLSEAISASDVIASSVALTPNTGVAPEGPEDSNPYFEMFGAMDMSGYPEILLWRDYDPGIKVWGASHSLNYTVSGGGIGVTRGLVMQFLDRNGLPWYSEGADFVNDDDLFVSRLGKGAKQGVKSEPLRDYRAAIFLRSPGQRLLWINEDLATKGVEYDYSAPLLPGPSAMRAPTGYYLRKGLNPDGINNTGNGTAQNGAPSFRAAEAFLTYIEAYYMLNKNLGGNATKYWEQLRVRAGIEPNTIQRTIDAIDVAKEAKYDWAAYTAGKLLDDKTLFAIRKERRSEFMCEALRYNDLRRWRAMDQMITTPYHPQGMKLWNSANWDLFADGIGDMTKYIAGKDLLTQFPAANAQISMQGDLTDIYSEDGDYIYPYRNLASVVGYEGMKWKMAHYLSPIEIKHITYTANPVTDLSTSPIYQNPYWPYEAGGSAEK